jgi:hypothetical protein
MLVSQPNHNQPGVNRRDTNYPTLRIYQRVACVNDIVEPATPFIFKNTAFNSWSIQPGKCTWSECILRCWDRNLSTGHWPSIRMVVLLVTEKWQVFNMGLWFGRVAVKLALCLFRSDRGWRRPDSTVLWNFNEHGEVLTWKPIRIISSYMFLIQKLNQTVIGWRVQVTTEEDCWIMTLKGKERTIQIHIYILWSNKSG